MNNLRKYVAQPLVIAALASVLFLSVGARDAIAQGVGSSCLNGEGATDPTMCSGGLICVSGAVNGTGVANFGTCQVTPEMSDYLAVAFIAVAGGMVFYFRRRAIATEI